MAKKPEDTSALREAMEEAGVPAVVIDHVLALKPARWIYWLATWGYIAVLVAGFGLGAVLSIEAESIVDSNAIARAAQIGGLLYKTNFGISFMVLIFAWVAAAALIVSPLTTRTPRARASMFAYSFSNPRAKRYLNWGGRLKAISVEIGPDDYISKAMPNMEKPLGGIVLTLVAMAMVILDREFQTYDIYSAEEYLATPLFPWDHEKTGKWRDARFVELGCNHVTGKHVSDDIIYDVVFDENSSVRISSAMPVNGSLLDQLEIIDQNLRDAGIPFRRWEWLDRNPLHPACLDAQKRRFSSADYQRIRRLLRVGEFASD